jgi:hypothetical protein
MREATTMHCRGEADDGVRAEVRSRAMRGRRAESLPHVAGLDTDGSAHRVASALLVARNADDARIVRALVRREGARGRDAGSLKAVSIA